MSDQKVALVIGASSGVGRAVAVLLAEVGYDLALSARREQALRETADLVRQDGRGDTELAVLPADATDPEAVRALPERVVERFGRLDALVNTAGVAPLMPIDRVGPDDWRQCIDANLSYVVNVTAAAWPVFRRQKAGVVVNVSSMASIDPFPGFAIYAAAKIGLNMFTRCTASEGRKLGVRAVAIAPGAIETDMLRGNFDEKKIPRDKTLDPFEVAGVIRDCVTGERSFESGETIELPSP